MRYINSLKFYLTRFQSKYFIAGNNDFFFINYIVKSWEVRFDIWIKPLWGDNDPSYQIKLLQSNEAMKMSIIIRKRKRLGRFIVIFSSCSGFFLYIFLSKDSNESREHSYCYLVMKIENIFWWNTIIWYNFKQKNSYSWILTLLLDREKMRVSL